jgi:hypothetical protein
MRTADIIEKNGERFLIVWRIAVDGVWWARVIHEHKNGITTEFGKFKTKQKAKLFIQQNF